MKNNLLMDAVDLVYPRPTIDGIELTEDEMLLAERMGIADQMYV